MEIQTFPPDSKISFSVILPKQCHGLKIVEIITGQEDLTDCDGVWTRNKDFILGIKTADCAPVCFSDSEKFGILHAGWRGLVSGICEKMLDIFNSPETEIFVGPMLPEFEIKKDSCYEAISQKFGSQFFVEKDDEIIFKFKDALASILPKAVFDPRTTFGDQSLSSWRRDKIRNQNNTTIIKS